MASRERRDEEVMDADSQRDACTGMLPYGVEGESAESREVRSVLEDIKIGFRESKSMVAYKCFDSSRAIFVKSEKNAGGKSGCFGPKRAMISHLGIVFMNIWNVYGIEQITYARSVLFVRTSSYELF